jgi:spore coat protein U-like protein
MLSQPNHTRSTLIRRLTAAAAIAGLLGGAVVEHRVQAATATTSILVSATILQSCAITALPLAFGLYDPTSSTPHDGSTTVSVICTTGTPFNIGLNAGGGSGATVASRKMTFGANLLNYTLYQDSNRTSLWGQTIGSDTVAGTATGLLTNFTVYGRIPAQQAAPTGIYTDTVTVTLTY